MERAAFISEWGAKKLRGVCVCTVGSRQRGVPEAQYAADTGTYAYCGWPDVDALIAAGTETDRKKREALLHQIQQTLPSACASDDLRSTWPSASAKVAEPALLLIDLPVAAPYEELRLK